jgi:hypothetical protein
MVTKKSRLDPTGRKGQPFVLRLPPELHRKLKMMAAYRDASLNQLMVDALGEWWTTQPDRGPFEKLAGGVDVRKRTRGTE